MAIYRGKGGKTDVIPADGDQEFAGSVIAEKDIHAHGNLSADGDITVKGDINWDGTITGDGSGLENVPTPFLQADDCIYVNNQVIDSDYTMPVGKNGMSAGDITVNGEVTIPDGSFWHVFGDDKEVSLEVLGIPNHELMVVDDGGNVTATSFNGNGSGLTDLPFPESYTKDEIDDQQEVQDAKIQANTDAIAAIPEVVNAYTKAEIDSQQGAQDTEIAKKADKTNVYTKTEIDTQQSAQDDEIDTKLGDAPSNGEQYVRKDGVWAELAAADGGITDAPADGKTYGRKDLKWEEITSDAYTKDEIDDQQDLQDAEIAKNAVDIEKNKTDIESLNDNVEALTGDIIWTEEDGVANYGGNIKVNGVVVGKGRSSSARNNVAVGGGANNSITTGTENTAIGVNALKDVTEGINNTGLGTYALFRVTEGSNNTAIGTSAGDNITTGSDNVVIGRGAKASSPTVSNEVVLGNDNVTKTWLKGNVNADKMNLNSVADNAVTSNPDYGLTVRSGGRNLVVSDEESNYVTLKVRNDDDTSYGFARVKAYNLSMYAEDDRQVFLGKGDLRLGKNELIKVNNTRVTMDLPEETQSGKVVKVNATGQLYTSTKSQPDDIDSLLDTKEDKGYGYSKSETDTKLGTKANTGDSYTKAESNATNSAQDTKIAANTAKVSNANHTGDVTGSTALTIGAKKVTGAKIADNTINALQLNVSGNGTTAQYLRSDGDGTFTWVTPPAGGATSTYNAVGAFSTYVEKNTNNTYPGVNTTVSGKKTGGAAANALSGTWRIMGCSKVDEYESSSGNDTRTYLVLIIRIS